MAFSTSGVNEIFASATVSNGDLTIPSGSINSFVPTSTTSPGVYEMCYGLLDTMSDAISTGNLTNVTASTSQNLSGSTLNRTYSFTVRLDLGSDIDEILNVRAEPTG